jgi:imidazolonepropionase-like amidohydrolase
MLQRLAVAMATAFTVIAALVAASLTPANAQSAAGPPVAQTVIHAGRLLADPATGRVETARTLVVADGRIIRIEAGYTAAPGVTVVDLKDAFVMPGLIDAHVHLLSQSGPGQRLDAVTQSEADFALMGMMYAQRTLNAGFTTVVDLGAGQGDDAIFAIRDQINAGRALGPRILAAGSTITPTGGHADVHGYRDDVMHVLGRESVCDGADDCRRAVREQVKKGSDIIKVTATGGVLSNTRQGLGQQFTDPELRAIVDTAHALGRKVTAHAHGVDGINAALRAGVDSIEHGTYLDDESIRLFKQKGAYLVPTVLAGAFVAEQAARPDSYFTPAQKEKALEVGPRMLDMLKRARRGGIKIAFGTDTGVSPHGDNAREAVLWVQAGFAPIDVVRAATVVAADHLGLTDEVGALKPGMAADVIAVRGDPLTDIRALQDVAFVMARGRVAKQ